ncbi:hypothetical protein Gotri_007237 [Gossypium trilobum]|uniref:LysM domain-containing protein n=1 Tax=Gossypium trilobum TaxID=34281 RepID=A0A7J9EFF6_9ROSI|nr:hypothetical protein [Gossypium trilobum]
MGFALLPVLVSVLTIQYSAAQSFKCSSSDPSTCHALVGYITVNNTNLGAIQSLFSVKNLGSLLGANNLPLNTKRSYAIPAQQVIKVPINCLCNNNTGLPAQIAAANNIRDPNLITIGDKLKIPLPCSCDEVDGQKVVHYAHMVKAGSSLGEIAQEFGTNEETLARINGIKADGDLKADQPIDVPLKACNSSISGDSFDFPLLAANGTYLFTANGCVKCMCDAANNWTLHCEPSQNKPSKWDTCPSMKCQGAEGLSIGNSTAAGCNRSTCSYAGFNNSTIMTTLVQDSSSCSSK